MFCLGSPRLVFGLPVDPVLFSPRLPCSSLRSFRTFWSTSTTTRMHFGQPNGFSTMADRRNDLFEYTSGRWIFNDDLRRPERERIFNVNELKRLAAESVNRSPNEIVRLEKLAEGGFNRTFLITMHCGFQMVARVPYPVLDPKYFAAASEVATMAFLRSSGLPTPEVYGYSPEPNNAAGTEYIFMEFVQGTSLGDIWFDLGEREIVSITHQIAELESKMMSIDFPAGGSLYYTEDLENVPRSPSESTVPSITLEDKRFCVGPDTSLPLWFGRRSQLDLDRGPYKNSEAALLRGAEKELAYMCRFGRPLLPFQRIRRDAYEYQKQPPSDHIENLDRYLRIASAVNPQDTTLCNFRIRHPDIQPNNIIVSTSPDSNLRIVGLIDWQHTSILPSFLLAGIPQQLQNYGDTVSELMERPSPPENLESISENQQSNEMEIYRRRLVHYHYVKNTEKYNKPHYTALMDPMSLLRRRLFSNARDLWEGETLALKVALIQATRNWERLTGGRLPCPIAFEPDDVRETMKLDAKQSEADELLENCQKAIGFGSEGWVPVEHYDEAMALSKYVKEDSLSRAESEEERALILEHWLLDDMDEEEYM